MKRTPAEIGGEALLAHFPDSPEAERARFMRARKGKVDAASSMLRAHVEWRAASLPPPADAKLLGQGLPPWNVMMDKMMACDGTRVLLAMAAMCDPDAGTPAEYALAAAVLLDQHLPRNQEELLTIVVDVGGVDGGANIAPSKLFGVIKQLSNVLSNNFPERVKRIVVFPIPLAVRGIWSAVKMFLDPVTASKAVLLAGGDAKRGCRYPKELATYIDMSTVGEGPLYGLPNPAEVGQPWRSAAAVASSNGVGAPAGGALGGTPAPAPKAAVDLD